MIGTVLLSDKYISLFYRYYSLCSSGHETLEDAISFLKNAADEGDLSEVAVIEKATKKMVWFHEFYGEKDCQNHVDRFIKANPDIF